ncbi:hypothetical protein TNCV_3522781 [Trichonephila clavipes]|uniref:Uncharacterized protein n=1 Tax=Trichonephila clavipes TaxID=2585209 RepID=A0A8X6W906_TRICX|nr:hypothetical protein TNCV_3522781 [Trichonephila clavipes]
MATRLNGTRIRNPLTALWWTRSSSLTHGWSVTLIAQVLSSSLDRSSKLRGLSSIPVIITLIHYIVLKLGMEGVSTSVAIVTSQ